MIIAVAAEGEKVTEHFGHCEGFYLYDDSTGKEVNFVANPGHRPGFLPNFLGDLGVNVIISGGMGGGAIDLFEQRGIQVIVGAQGKVQDVMKAYVDGALVSTGSVCHDHVHHDTCGNH